jgi:hypothetical protein
LDDESDVEDSEEDTSDENVLDDESDVEDSEEDTSDENVLDDERVFF